MMDDAELLRRYAGSHAEEAFAELVRRHVNLVYRAALRQCGGDAHRAQDVTQLVFTLLARKAATLTRHPSLTGWLYTTTHHTVRDVRRAERRRTQREQEALIMHEPGRGETTTAQWERLRPVLDDAMQELAGRDRDAILRRFFEGRSFAQIGAGLSLTEDAARMRVERALEKLRTLLARRGVTSTSAALGLMLTSEAATAAPAGMAAAITGTTLAGVTSSGGVTTALSSFAFMSTSNVSLSVAVVAAIAALGAVIYEARVERATEAALVAATHEKLTASNRWHALTRRAETVAQQTAQLQRSLDEVSATAIAAEARLKPAAMPQTPLEAGRAFLAAHPEAQRLLDDTRRGFFAETYGVTLLSLGLTPVERDAIASEASKEMSWKLGVSDLEFAFNQDDGPRGEEATLQRLRELLGEPRFQQFEGLRRLQAARSLTQTVAAATFDSDTPLTAEQAGAIVQTLDRHNLLVGSRSGPVNLNVIDWPAVTRELASVLSVSQLAALDAAHVQATQSLPTAARAPVGAATQKP